MKILRWVLGAVVALWALFNLWPLHAEVAYKAGWIHHVPPDMARMIPLIDATPWWALGLWGAIVLLLLASAWRLFRGGQALVLYAIALVGHIAMWQVHSHLPAYSQVFTAQEIQSDYYILGVQVLVGLLIWWSERRKAAA